jgi:hypothetical protein
MTYEEALAIARSLWLAPVSEKMGLCCEEGHQSVEDYAEKHGQTKEWAAAVLQASKLLPEEKA